MTGRRNVLRMAGILGGSGIGLGAYSLAASEPAAALEVTGWNVGSELVEIAPDEQVLDVVGVADLSYEYAISHQPDAVEFTAEVSNGDGEWYALDAQRIDDPPTEDSGSLSLSGSVLETAALSAENFAVDEGATISVTIHVAVTMTILRNGSVVAVADKTDDGNVAVSKEELTASAALGGSGSWQVDVGSA